MAYIVDSDLRSALKNSFKQQQASDNTSPIVGLHTLWAQIDTPAQSPPHFAALLQTLKTRFRVATALFFMAQKGAVVINMCSGREPGALDCTSALALCRNQPDQLLVIEDVPELDVGATGPQPVRFYAGAPLVIGSDGLPAGMLCLIGIKPRGFSSADRVLLNSLASAISAMLLMPHNPGAAQAIALSAKESVLLLDAAR